MILPRWDWTEMSMDHILESVNLPVVPFGLKISVKRGIRWNSYPGSVIHGVLGFALKNLTCVMKHRNCKRCHLVHSCAYGIIYESALPPDSKRMRLYPQTPHPIKITVYPWDVESAGAGEYFDIHVTLIGKATDCLLMMLMALEQALGEGVGRKHQGARGNGEIVNVLDGKTGVTRDWEELKVNYSQFIERCQLYELGDATGNRDFKLCLATPLKLITDGKVNHYPTFRDLTANLLRRIANLAYFYSGREWEADWPGLLNMAENVEFIADLKKVRAKRYSSRQKATIGVGGLVGEIQVKDCPPDLANLFLAGQYVGLGKGTTIGQGDFSVV